MPDRNSSLKEWGEYGSGRIYTIPELIERTMTEILSPEDGAEDLGKPMVAINPLQVERSVACALYRLKVQWEKTGKPDAE